MPAQCAATGPATPPGPALPVYQRGHQTPANPAFLGFCHADQRRNSRLTHIADHDGRASATCTLVIVPNLTRGGHPYALVENVVTRCELRSRGYGRAVLDADLSQNWAAGC